AALPRDLRHALAFGIRRFWTDETSGSLRDGKISEALHARLDALWSSTSWRALRPLRNLMRSIAGRPPEAKPVPANDDEALAAILAIMKSSSWDLTSPIRLMGRLLHIRGRPAPRQAGD